MSAWLLSRYQYGQPPIVCLEWCASCEGTMAHGSEAAMIEQEIEREELARPVTPDRAGRGFLARWVVAFVAGEIVGFGLAVTLGFTTAPAIDQLPSAPAFIVTIAVAALAGVIEGGVVGWAQWTVARHLLPTVREWDWIQATAGGGAVAWAIGMTLGISLSFEHEPPWLVVTVVAAALGVLVGTIFGVAQWTVLRHHVAGAGRWIIANAVAWAVGIAVAFGGIGAVPNGAPLGTFILAGMATGAVMALLPAFATGVTLLRLARE
jgi:hypothetical protein